MPTETVDLANHGLSDGDDIGPYIDEHWNDGVEVRIPAGSYQYDGTGLNKSIGDASLVGSPDGVEFHNPGPDTEVRPFIRSQHGTVRVENITVRGVKPGHQSGMQSRWRFDAEDPDSRIEVVNVNHPDGSEDDSDSLAFYTGKYHAGEVLYKNCYVGPHGNSAIYANVGSEDDSGVAPVIVDNCVFVDPNNAVRVGHDQSVYRDNTIVWRNEPNGWKDGSGYFARAFRCDDPHEGHDILFENNHFYFGDAVAGSCGGSIEFEGDGMFSGVVRDHYVATEGDCGGLIDKGAIDGFTFENVNSVGPGAPIRIDADGVSQGNTAPDLRNEDVVWMPESETVRPAGGSGDSTSTEPEGDMFTIMSTSDTEDVLYRFEADGDIHRDTDPNFDGASSEGEANVAIDNSVDPSVAEGKTGAGFGDSFLVTGPVVSFEQTGGQSGYDLYLNGEPFTLDDGTSGDSGSTDGDHTHEEYAAVDHNHDDAYAPLGHTHSVYVTAEEARAIAQEEAQAARRTEESIWSVVKSRLASLFGS